MTPSAAALALAGDLLGICDCGAPTRPDCEHCSETVELWAERIDAHVAERLRALADDPATAERVAKAIYEAPYVASATRMERCRILARAALAAVGGEA